MCIRSITPILLVLSLISIECNQLPPTTVEPLSHGIELMSSRRYQQDPNSIQCIAHITNHYFGWEPYYGSANIIINFTGKVTVISNLLIKWLMINFDYKWNVIVKSVHTTNTIHRKETNIFDAVASRVSNYFAYINETRDVEATVRQWKSDPTWNNLAQVIVLMHFTYDNTVFGDKQKEVLAVFLRYKMLNVKLLTFRHSSSTMDVISWLPFDNGNCANRVIDLVSIGSCEYTDEGFEYNEFLAAQKIVSPRRTPGCPIRIATSIQEPYVYYNRTTRIFDGLEVVMVRNIAYAMDLRPTFLLINEVRSNRVVSNVTGIYSTLLQGSVMFEQRRLFCVFGLYL